jgi:hypothetical protein
MQSISHTYISLYATSDNETHFRMVQVRLDLVEDFAIPAQALYIGGTLSSRRAFLLAFPPNGVNQMFHGESGTRRLPAKSPRSCRAISSIMPVTAPRMKWDRGT